MKKILLPIFAFGLVSCSQTSKQSESKTTDSTLMQNDIVNEYELASIYRDLDSDSLLADNDDLLRLNEFLTKGTKIKEKEYGGGDCGGKFKQLSFKTDTLTVDKYDCGDYGFGNTEFITRGDSLRFVREFKMEWLVDSTGSKFNVSETIYYFSSLRSTRRTRTRSVPGWKDFSIRNTDFEEGQLQGQKEYNEFKKELKDLALKEKLGE
jgi:hypothetical protein